MIVEDPLRPGNQVLSFTALNSGGDIFGSEISVTSGATYTLSFEYLGLYDTESTAREGDLGGFIGLAQATPGTHRWLHGTNTTSGAKDVLIDDGQWQNYSITFDSSVVSNTTLRVMLEDYTGSSGVPSDIFFDNVAVMTKESGGTESDTAVLRWIDFGKDRVSSGNNPNPDGQGDGHFSVTLDLSSPKTVEVITLYTTDDQGNPAFGQVWNTAPDGFWILGVYRDGTRLNPQDTLLRDEARGEVAYDVYGNDSGYFDEGQRFGVTVGFSDGTEVKALCRFCPRS